MRKRRSGLARCEEELGASCLFIGRIRSFDFAFVSFSDAIGVSVFAALPVILHVAFLGIVGIVGYRLATERNCESVAQNDATTTGDQPSLMPGAWCAALKPAAPVINLSQGAQWP